MNRIQIKRRQMHMKKQEQAQDKPSEYRKDPGKTPGPEIKEEAENNKVFYGDSREVNSVEHYDINDYVKLPSKNQRMSGFDPQYRDFVDYIIKITHKIWEEKGIGVIYDTYHNNVTMHTGSKSIVGIQAVISGTMQTLHSMPDRRLIGQNVIWSPLGEKGYLSSHRVMSTATNTGDSAFGKATGKKLTFRTVIDCACENNRIYEEWLVRDNLTIVEQMGLDPKVVAKQLAAKDKQKQAITPKNFGLGENMKGQYMPEKYRARDASVGEKMLEMLSHVYNYRLFNSVRDYYSDNACMHYVGNKDLHGHGEIQGMLISFFASFPNAQFIVDRVTCNEKSEKEEWDLAVRWRIKGMHEGIGFFGAPTGKPVNILGINHYHIRKNKIVEEWVTYDALDVLRQVADVEEPKEQAE